MFCVTILLRVVRMSSAPLSVRVAPTDPLYMNG
jgi:hypothetical protein